MVNRSPESVLMVFRSIGSFTILLASFILLLPQPRSSHVQLNFIIFINAPTKTTQMIKHGELVKEIS